MYLSTTVLHLFTPMVFLGSSYPYEQPGDATRYSGNQEVNV